MGGRRYRVGIVGLEAGRSWAAMAHLPALRALRDDYEVVGVANRSRESTQAAADACGLPRAFNSVAELVSSPEIDVVVVTVKAPNHFPIVSAAIVAGKAVYCEWPLGKSLGESVALADLAREGKVLGVIGTQAPFALEIRYLRDLLQDGYVGEVLSTTLVGTGINWGGKTRRSNAYTLDRANGATMLTIPLAHTLAALTDALGPVAGLSAMMATRRTTAHNVDTGETLLMTSPDQVLVSGVLQSGAPISIHYRGGGARGVGLVWEIHGTNGDLRITGGGGHAQLVQLSLAGGKEQDDELRPLPLPEAYAADAHDGPVAGNVRRVYAAMASDLRNGTHLAPTFDDALKTHRLVSAIEQAAATGERVRP